MRFLTVLSAAAILAAPAAFAQDGDAAAGEREFRQCSACHMITGPGGETIARGGRVGPNLYGVMGREVASVDGFRYQPGITAVGEAGTIWEPENMAAYLADTTGYIRSVTGNNSHRSGMAFQLRGSADNIIAFLISHSPDYVPGGEAEAEAEAPAAN
jgi:cytochrome c